ncbi:Zn(II)2Cys6 transcription factor [Aspergillus stella-maris]|uniref:Zn(II)2Cys6 transcription factor n=1 Tax=Aspergillus stella-maris TaxID=1810926 RepID=UPI003CCDB16E
MKRSYAGVPPGMTHSWGQPPSSCQQCRAKKRRCDRQVPCWNCAQRGMECVYSDQVGSQKRVRMVAESGDNVGVVNGEGRMEGERGGGEEMLERLKKLEEAVFRRANGGSESMGNGASGLGSQETEGNPQQLAFRPFCSHPGAPLNGTVPDEVHSYLPPLPEARELFDHFSVTMHPTMGILHISSTKHLLEETYRNLFEGITDDKSAVALLFTIFAGSALSATPTLLEKLKATQDEASAGGKTYLNIARSAVESLRSATVSTTGLSAIIVLANLITNESGHGLDGHLLRSQCYWMARSMEVHLLDTPKRQEERRVKGCNTIEFEVQRRIWWNLIATDWLSSFSGTAQEGTYLYHPSHMCVDLPANVDDSEISATEPLKPKPLSEPTSSTFLIYRVKLASVCRGVVDSMPPIAWSTGPCYDTVLALDARFHDCLAALPGPYQLSQDTLITGEQTCDDRPYIVWQRTTAHLSVHTRLCRLHRPYHLKGMTDPTYKYSRDACVRSAQIVLDLRRSMDETQTRVGFTPARFWIVAQHVFLAALTLATDVSFDGNALDAEIRRQKVLAAYETLEKSTEESCGFRETIQKNLRTLMATLNREGREVDALNTNGPANLSQGHSIPLKGLSERTNMAGAPDGEGLSDGSAPWEENWDQLWSEFLAVAPDLDFSQWDKLLDGTDT